MGLVDLLVVFGVPLGLLASVVLPYIRVGVELADEGYLVFGTAKILDGQVPIRDFRAYDPGRYYLCALFALIFGRGYLATRIAMATVMAMTLCLLAHMMLLATSAPVVAALTCALALIWLQPRSKQIEHCFTVLGIFVLFNLTDAPTAFDFTTLGAVIGLSAFFGLNIVIYLTGASVLVFALMLTLPSGASLAGFMGGVVVGLLPMLLMIVCAKGFFRDYLNRKVLVLIKRGTTNLALPLPWLWTLGKTGFDALPPPQKWGLMAIFTLIPLVFVGGLRIPFVIDLAEASPAARLLFVTSCVGLVNFHHTLSRADKMHLFLPTLPLCMALALLCLTGLGEIGAALVILLAIAGSIYLVWTEVFHPTHYRKISHAITVTDTVTDRLWLQGGLCKQIDMLQKLTLKWTAKGDPILAAPVNIGLCTLFDRPNAIFDSFPVYPSTPATRQAVMADLAQSQPKLLLIAKMAIDRREELMFLNNYPDVAQLIATDYTKMDTIGQTEVYLRSDLLRSE